MLSTEAAVDRIGCTESGITVPWSRKCTVSTCIAVALGHTSMRCGVQAISRLAAADGRSSACSSGPLKTCLPHSHRLDTTFNLCAAVMQRQHQAAAHHTWAGYCCGSRCSCSQGERCLGLSQEPAASGKNCPHMLLITLACKTADW